MKSLNIAPKIILHQIYENDALYVSNPEQLYLVAVTLYNEKDNEEFEEAYNKKRKVTDDFRDIRFSLELWNKINDATFKLENVLAIHTNHQDYKIQQFKNKKKEYDEEDECQPTPVRE